LKGVKKYWFRHRLISVLRDIDVKGIRALSVILPKWILPNPHKTEPYVLQTIHGFALEIDPRSDLGVERSLHETGTYEKGVITFLTTILKKGDCFVDVGANIGLLSIHASKCVGPEGNVFAIEPNPKTLPILYRNIESNKVKNIKIFEVALGEKSHITQIFENRDINRGGSSLIVNVSNEKGIPVQVEPLDDFLNLIDPMVIKIDVEGYEFEVLKGAVKTISRAKPILIIETALDKNKTMEWIEFINSIYPYKIFKFKKGKERKSNLVELTDLSDLPIHDNLIFLP
jgi:FkbM family methyltransferase